MAKNYDKIIMEDVDGSKTVVTYEEYVLIKCSGDAYVMFSFTLDGFMHRLDGPAREYKSGHKEWYINGMLHREDGPAIEWPHVTRSWWVNGKRIKVERWINVQ